MGAVTRFPIPLMVAIAYAVVLIIPFNAALPGATVVLVLVGIVVVMPYLLMAKTMANNRRFQAARSALMPGEEVRFWWKAGLFSFGERWVIVTTERLVIPRVGLLRMRTRSIPFAEIYLADTSERSIGVGAYGGGAGGHHAVQSLPRARPGQRHCRSDQGRPPPGAAAAADRRDRRVVATPGPLSSSFPRRCDDERRACSQCGSPPKPVQFAAPIQWQRSRR